MKYYPSFKRFLDLFLVFFSLPFVILFTSLISLLIFIFDKGPIFYSSDRIGNDFKVFKMYKFRTMKLNSSDLRNPDGSTFNSKNDFRVTKIGFFLRKYSIDEIPQIFNVLLGDMSIIGPRPDLPDQLIMYSKFNLDQSRFKVKPGITGYAQVIKRNLADPKKRNQLDIYYVKNISLLLDIKILFMTITNVLLTKNIHRN